MARGFLSGLIWGGIVASGGAVVASLVTDLPASPDVADRVPDNAAEVAPLEVDTGNTPQAAGPAGRVDGVSAVGPDTPQPDAPAGVDTDPANVPQVGDVASGLDEPVAPGALPDVSAQTSPREVPGTPGAAPQIPDTETDLSISTEPAQPALPPLETETPEPAVTAEPSEETTEEEAPAIVEMEPGAGEAELGASTDTEAVTEAIAEAETADETAPGTQEGQPEPDSAEPDVVTEEPAAPRVAALPQSGEGVTIGDRVLPLTERTGPNTRLPSVGDATEEPEAEAAPEPVAPPVSGPPIAQFAMPFENPENKPLMGIVLIDDDAAIGVEALSSFPYPVTFAVDMTAPDASEKMARHRAAGFEVVALADLPQSAAAGDAEVALEAGLAAVSEAVAVLEGTGDGLQGNRALSDQVTAILNASGHGLILQDNGLNTAQKLAEREGVPSATVFRDFDGAGQTPTVMRRFLDQAAFRAGQQGDVIMMGRVRPDTISALLLWGLQDRASRVALAPISAVLTQVPAEE